MQVILLEKVANLGNLGDVVKVKDGFARNFLLPQGKAKRATEANRKAFEARRAELEVAQAEALAKAKERGAKMDGLTLQIVQKAGVDGRLFGSVTNYDIVEALKAQGHEVERAMVRMPAGPIKQVGEVRAGQQRGLGVVIRRAGGEPERADSDHRNPARPPAHHGPEGHLGDRPVSGERRVHENARHDDTFPWDPSQANEIGGSAGLI